MKAKVARFRAWVRVALIMIRSFSRSLYDNQPCWLQNVGTKSKCVRSGPEEKNHAKKEHHVSTNI